MKLHYGIAAGTALGLLMATTQIGAAPATSLPRGAVSFERPAGPPLLTIQACPEDDPDCDEDDAEADDEVAPTGDTIQAPRPPAQAAPPAQIDGAAEPVPEPAPPAQIDGAAEPIPEPAPPAQIDGAAEPVPEPAPPAEPEAPSDTIEAPRPPAEQPPAEEPAPPPGGAEPIPGEAEPAPPPAEEPPAEDPPMQRPPAEQPPAEQPPAEEPAPPPGGAEPIPGEAEPTPPPAGEAPAEQPPAEQVPAEDPPMQRPPAEQPPAEQPPAEQPAPPVGAPEPVSGQAPMLDSDKEAPSDAAPVAEETGPPPTSDAEAQQFEEPVEVQPLREEEGRRVERSEERPERREGTDVLREVGDRIVIQFNNQIVVESSDRGRLEQDATEVYYEELPRGRTRETIVRPNGVQVVTIRDRYGDIVRRSRITPDGREYVLVYGDDRRAERRGVWVDPADELPPLRLTIPVEEYILDARRAPDPRAYYEFFDLPPVEPVRRLYSIDEVKYSARVRDSVRRVDLDTITFDFGSASIAEGEVMRLQSIATAMVQMLDENPGETFLIEGHTDAVGSDEANLVLSDRRAEAVALALTAVFDVPPENLVTQGYGKRYLKIDTQEPERQNRRVAIRRITPLVAPVASR